MMWINRASFGKESFVHGEGGKLIPVHAYHKEVARKKEELRIQTAVESLSQNEKHLLSWWQNHPNSVVTMPEICKCLTPPELRKAAIIRPLILKLLTAGLIQTVGPFYHKGIKRKEAWRLEQLPKLAAK